MQRVKKPLVNMKGSNGGKIHLNRRILDGIGQEGSEQTKRPFVRRTRGSIRMELAQLMTETDDRNW